ncbi:unnamed protein product [Blepharisma stoltei]|uniref:beta-ketoacyl-[acyl-carrier-protein] synthase I n=1 Tax=Blepharisma stoltei TaxID=1481888 RepID=A0AAU9KEK5_9CILI|nr:unnamed protein product [Blepharisma stoltei]
MRRVVVTGIGMVTPLGNSATSTFQALCNGECGISRINNDQFRALPVQIGGIPKFQPESWLSKLSIKSLCNTYALAACTEALEQANYKKINKNDIGIVMDSCSSDIVSANKKLKNSENSQESELGPSLFMDSRSRILAEYFDIFGYNNTVVTPLGALASVGHGFNTIQDGNSKAVLVIGSQHCVEPIHIQALDNLGLLNRDDNGTPNNSMRPYDINAKGIVLGEGAAALVLEDYEHAKNRSAEIIAEILSFARTNDAKYILKADEEGNMMDKAISLSLERANVDEKDISLVIGEGSGLHEKDRVEIQALEKLLNYPSVTTYRAGLGNMMAASGPVQAALGAISIKEGKVFPIHNFSASFRIKGSIPDIDFVKKCSSLALENVLLTGISIGGNNYAMVLSKANRN